MLLSAPFSSHAEPIVDSMEDAVVCYLASGLDYPVVGGFLASRKPWDYGGLAKLIF